MSRWLRIALLLGLSLWALGAAAAEPYFRPSKGNQYAAKTDKYLYVIWAVPNDLSPFAGISEPDAREAFIARTAILLCREHLSVDPSPATPCKFQVVRMTTNDEYTKSAAGGFKTVATLVLDKARATEQTLRDAVPMRADQLRALFSRFTVHHERLKP